MTEAHDTVFLQGLTFFGYHGVRPEERTTGQRFQVDVEVTADVRRAGSTDDLTDTVNYAQVFRTVREIMEGEPRNLMETLAEAIAGRVLAEHPAQAVRVRISKLGPPLRGAPTGQAGVEIYRTQPGRGPGPVSHGR